MRVKFFVVFYIVLIMSYPWIKYALELDWIPFYLGFLFGVFFIGGAIYIRENESE